MELSKVRVITLDDFLKRGDASMASVVAGIAERVPFDAGDSLVAVGSLVEGLGTTKSDLDVWVVKQGPLQEEVHFGLIVGRSLLDVEVLCRQRIIRLAQRLQDWTALPWNVSMPAEFSLTERGFLHRLITAYDLDANQSAGLPKPSVYGLSRLKFHVARQLSRTVQVDMAGLRDCGDSASLVFAAQELLGHVIDGMSAVNNATNPLPKWRIRLLNSLGVAFARLAPEGEALNWHVLSLHRPPVLPNVENSILHALRVTTFARRVFAELEHAFIFDADGEQNCDRQIPSPPVHLDFDVDYSFAGDNVVVARLNEFDGNKVEIPTQDFLDWLSASVGARCAGSDDSVAGITQQMIESGLTSNW